MPEGLTKRKDALAHICKYYMVRDIPLQTAPVQKEKIEVKAEDGEDEIVMSDGEGNEGYVTESGQDQQLAKNMRRIMKI